MKIKTNEELLYEIKNRYEFKNDAIVARIAFGYSLSLGALFSLECETMPSNGKDFRDTTLFGSIINGGDNTVIFKSALDQHYNKRTSDEEFKKLFKQHLQHGLNVWNKEIGNSDTSKGGHIKFLLKVIKKGLSLRNNIPNIKSSTKNINIEEYVEPLSFSLGETEEGKDLDIKINDLREFTNRNIAIAGMTGSGKTELMKDILYQISQNTNKKLKFIFFDYKGVGNPKQLKPFLEATNCEFVDVIKDGGLKFNPFLSISLDKRQRPFSIKAFAETIAMFTPNIGVVQMNLLINIIENLFDDTNGSYPTIDSLFSKVKHHYEKNKVKEDTLYAGIQDLTRNIFNCDPKNKNILESSIYLNLRPDLSDTLRQLIVFLLLRYFNTYFSSTNDCEVNNDIFPLRYILVIDEVHIYLKNKNARKVLEGLLRLLRSKGVIIFMLSQEVEDFKQKDFDFASQVSLPICLNVKNKDYKAISSFVGTPKSKFELEGEIKKLESGKGLINLGKPKIIQLKQFWKTIKNNS